MKRITDPTNEIVIPIIAFFWNIFWKPTSFIFRLIFKLLSDVAKNVYGRLVIILGAMTLAYLCFLFLHL